MKTNLTLPTVLALLLAPSAAAGTFSVSGPGGPIPDCPFNPGTWNNQPNWPTFTSQVNASLPVASVTLIKISGLNHTFRGDIHVFLHDPLGNRHNVIVRPGFDGNVAGDPGNYNLGTYDIVENGGAALTQGAVNINGGTYDQFLNNAGGSWTSGTYLINNTPLNSISGPAGIWTLEIADWFIGDVGSLSGWTMQGLVAPSGVTFCEPGVGGVISCPCGNFPSGPGRGCNNSANTGGATLSDVGAPSLSADTLVFTTTGEKPVAVSIVLQGTIEILAGVPYGDGVRCLGGLLKRLYTKNAVGGSITAPQGGDLPVSVRSSSLGDTIAPGQLRYYMVYYRDGVPGFGCPSPGSATFNTSSSKRISWLL